MGTNPEKAQEQMRHFRDVFRISGTKLTQQRLMVFREVARSEDHPDALTIHKQVLKKAPTISLDTVYRTLWLLLDLDLITTLGSPHRGVRFDANTRSHHHFICTECGAAQDFTSEEFDQLPVPATVRQFGSVERIRVELCGLCSNCRHKKKHSPPHITRGKKDSERPKPERH